MWVGQLLMCSVVHRGWGTLQEPTCLQLCTACTSWPWCRQEVPDGREVVEFISSKYMDVLSVRVEILDICIAK